jgi:hypothetical protein
MVTKQMSAHLMQKNQGTICQEFEYNVMWNGVNIFICSVIVKQAIVKRNFSIHRFKILVSAVFNL